MFFFFQAEDGIRDKLVTGVQTCALPISTRSLESPELNRRKRFAEKFFLRRFEKNPQGGEIDLMLLAFPVVQAANLGQSGTKNLPNQKQGQNSGDHYDERRYHCFTYSLRVSCQIVKSVSGKRSTTCTARGRKK